jgi:drug/metabolite transporter (DMT)-like permease
MQLKRLIGIILLVVGIVLVVMGIQATDSFSSQFSKFFTGSPTDHAVWLTLGGIAAILAGGTLAAMPFRTSLR